MGIHEFFVVFDFLVFSYYLKKLIIINHKKKCKKYNSILYSKKNRKKLNMFNNILKGLKNVKKKIHAYRIYSFIIL